MEMQTYKVTFSQNGFLVKTVRVEATHDYKAVSLARKVVKVGFCGSARCVKMETKA